jgi:hypothetical protein
MNKKRIAILPFPNIQNAYIIISAKQEGEPDKIKVCTTFFFDSGKGIGAEWEPEYGPITTLYSVPADDPEAQEHWFYPFIDGYGHWSQLAVNKYNLKEAFANGDYKYIFNILSDFCGNKIGILDALFCATGLQTLPNGINPQIV